MFRFRKNVVVKNILFIVLCVFWFFFAFRLIVKNSQLLYRNYVTFHNKTSTEKLNILFGEDYPTFAFISKNTSPHATVLLLSDTDNVFFDYYLYPRKIMWSNNLKQHASDEYLNLNHIDMIISYDENNNIEAHTIQQ